MSPSVSARIEQLRREICRLDHLYYVEAKPAVSDLHYDRMLAELTQLENQHPEFRSPDSPTQRIGDAPVEHLAQVAHQVPMLSIDNTYSLEDLKAYFQRTEKLLEGEPIDWVMEYKIDGVAASVRYQRGVMIQAVTRGNGLVGDDITHNLRTVRDLPLRTTGETVPELLEIRGEVYMTNQDLTDLNLRQVAAGAEPFKNTRNVTAGTVRLLDPSIAAQRRLKFFCHGVGEAVGMNAKTHMEFLELVRRLGIPPTPAVQLLPGSEAALAAIAKLEKRLPELPFEVDGMVFKVNDFAQREKLGMTSKSPRWLIAYKFERYEAITQLESISVQVGKTGAITPVANLTPVEIAGTTVSRASLHNADEIERLDVREGDTVVVEKAGKIIPKIVRVEKHLRTHPLVAWKYPSHCPVCEAKLVRDEGGVYIRCPNPACPAQLRQRLIYFGSRAGMDIDGLGEEVVDLLIHHDLVHQVADLYRLSVRDISSLPWPKQRKGKAGQLRDVQLGEKNAQNLVEGIQRSKQRGLARVLSSLSIRHVGPRVAQLIARQYPSIEQLESASLDDLANIHEIGAAIAESVRGFIHSPVGQHTLAELAAVGVDLTESTASSQSRDVPLAGKTLAGKTLVVTGSLQQFTREEIEQLIAEMGGRATATVSKKTDFLVVGDKAGSKLDKAKKLGVKILSETEFRDLIASPS
jgi:DNA ligase (NAD+)